MIEKSNSMIDASLWNAYSRSYFRFHAEWECSSYAVITAWNPFSKWRSNKENYESNQRLEARLHGRNYVAVTVGDKAFHWYEESFAAEIEPEEAIELAKAFRQNAIYYVENGQLSLIGCVEPHIRQRVGQIKDKLLTG